MPGFDRTGPAGGGPMTGWARGNCNPSGSYGVTGAWPRRAIGFGFGRGRGFRHMFWATGLPRWGRGPVYWPNPYLATGDAREDEIAVLREDAEMLKKELEAIERRMNDLQSAQRAET